MNTNHQNDVLLREFREKFVKEGVSGSYVETMFPATELEAWLQAAFDKVRAEAKKEVVEYITLRSKKMTDGNGKVLGYETYKPIFDQVLSPPSGGTK